jgi:integrase
MFPRAMEQEGRMRSTVAPRLSTLCSFYRYCHLEGLLERNPAANVPRPKIDPESRTLGLDRNELGALLVQAGLGWPRDHALISLLAMNGLRISEALGANIDDLDVDRGHRTLRVVHKSGRQVSIPLAPRTVRALDLYIGERAAGPIFLGAAGGRMDRYAADRTVKRLPRRAGITKRISPHSVRHSFIAAALDAGVPLRDVQEAASHADPRTTMRYDRPDSRSTVTPRTSSPLSSPAPPADSDSWAGRYRVLISPGSAGYAWSTHVTTLSDTECPSSRRWRTRQGARRPRCSGRVARLTVGESGLHGEVGGVRSVRGDKVSSWSTS